MEMAGQSPNASHEKVMDDPIKKESRTDWAPQRSKAFSNHQQYPDSSHASLVIRSTDLPDDPPPPPSDE